MYSDSIPNLNVVRVHESDQSIRGKWHGTTTAVAAIETIPLFVALSSTSVGNLSKCLLQLSGGVSG